MQAAPNLPSAATLPMSARTQTLHQMVAVDVLDWLFARRIDTSATMTVSASLKQVQNCSNNSFSRV